MFIPLACVSRLSFFSVSLVQLSFFCLCLCLFIYIYIYLRLILFSLIPYVSFFCFIIPNHNVFDSVMLPIIFCQCLIITSLIRLISTYSRILFSLPRFQSPVCRLFCVFILSFSYFSRSIIFFSLFFFICICLSCLSTCVLFVIFDPTAAAYSSRETNIRSVIQHL